MGFHGSILQLARTARCPVVLTAESNPFFFLRWLNNIKPTPKSGFLHASDPSTGFQMFSSDSSKRGSPELCQGLTLFTLSDCDFRATNRTIELIGSGNGLDENFSGSKWSQWLLTKGIDIALFDDFRSILYRCFNKKLQQFPTAIEHKKIFQPNFEDILKFKKCCWHYPVIHEVLPHCTLQTESSLVVIHGRHFLQPTTSLRSESIAHVSVEIGGTGCECVLMSDTEIVVKVAPLCANTLLAGETFIQRVVVVVSPYDGAGPKCPPLRSDYCGDGCGIIRNISKLLKHATEFAVCTRPISQKIKSDVRNSSFKKSKKNSKLFRVNSVDNLSNSGDEVELSINGKSASQLKKRRKLLILDSDEEMVSDTNNIDLISSTDLERDHRYCFEKDSEGVFSSENSMVLDQYKVLAMQRSCESFTTSLRQCMLSSLQVLKRFDALSYLFLDPVDPIAYPDYYEIVKKPIDLHSIEESVNRDLYHRPVSISTHEKTGACNNIIALNLPSITAFLDDVRRIWSNCLLYNCDNGDLIEATVVLSIIFEVYFRDSLAKLAATYQSGIYGNDCTDRNQGILQVVEVLAPKLVEIRLCKVVIDTFPACPTIWEEFQRGSQDWPSFSNFNEWLVFAKKLVTESISKPDLSPKRFLSQFFDVDDGGVKTLKQPIDIDLTLKSNDIDLPASPDLVSLIAEIDRDRAETNLEMVPAGLEYCRSFASSPQWSGPSLEFREQSLMDSFLLHNISIYADALSASETLSAFATELDSFGDQEEELFNDINDKNAFNNNIVRSYSGSEDAFAISSISFYLRQMSQLSLQENICSIDDEKIMTFNTLLNGNSHQNPCTEHDPLHINDIRPIEWSYFSNLRYEFNPSTETTSLATNSTPPKLSDCSESEITTNEVSF